MGGRGASSGTSKRKDGTTVKYGSEFKTVLKSGNIKFVKAKMQNSELLETMTKGRVYVLVNKEDNPSHIVYFDNDNKRKKTIDLRHLHKGIGPHTHHGYWHNEDDGAKGATRLDTKERAMVEDVLKIWYNHKHNGS